MTRRIIEEIPCEHGLTWGPHPTTSPPDECGPRCPGGSRRELTIDNLFIRCSTCGGTGSIETSQSEDGRFSYQDQCPACSSRGVIPLTGDSK
jgi:hypothetical protein